MSILEKLLLKTFANLTRNHPSEVLSFVSSDINEVIRAIISKFFFFFTEKYYMHKILHSQVKIN